MKAPSQKSRAESPPAKSVPLSVRVSPEDADFIAGVQQNDFRSLDESLTFDGLLVQLELRF